MTTGFLKTGRSEIDGKVVAREFKIGIFESETDALAALIDSLVSHTDDREGAQAFRGRTFNNNRGGSKAIW